MAHIGNARNQTTKWIRWIARGIGSFVATYWLFMGIGYGIAEAEPWPPESLIMAALISTSVLGVVVAWLREGVGGLILAIVAAAHSAFAYVAAGHNQGFAMLISGGPFLLIGSLFLVIWHRSRMLERGG